MQHGQARREERGDPLLVAILVSPIGTSRWPARTQAVARLRPLAATARRGAARTAERSADWWGRAQGRGWTGTAGGRTVPPAAGRHGILGTPLEIPLEIEAGLILFLDFLARVRNCLAGPRRAISKRRKPAVKLVNCSSPPCSGPGGAEHGAWGAWHYAAPQVRVSSNRARWAMLPN